MGDCIYLDDLIQEMNKVKTYDEVYNFIKKYSSVLYLTTVIEYFAEELIAKGEADRAILFYLGMINLEGLEGYDEFLAFFRLGEYYINIGEIEKGKSYLIKMCNEYENYEDSVVARDLSNSWSILRQYVTDDIKPSLHLEESDEKGILTDDELLDLLLTEIASGGLHSYLTSYGYRLEETLEAAKSQNKLKTVELLELIKTKYFGGKMPEKQKDIENIIFENEWWFEKEFDKYYYEIEKELC